MEVTTCTTHIFQESCLGPNTPESYLQLTLTLTMLIIRHDNYFHILRPLDGVLVSDQRLNVAGNQGDHFIPIIDGKRVLWSRNVLN